MRPSFENTTTMPSETSGGALIELETEAVQRDLPSAVPNASTSPLSVPTTTTSLSAPGPAESDGAALTDHVGRPVSRVRRVSVPLLAAAYTASLVIAGANPGAAFATLACHCSCAVALGVNWGSGPGFLLPPVSQSNEGVGIDGI